tara:strand:+ start:79 stop:282 length:204 start_codon:yes stop_codon:yes gene_type:complete
MESDVSEFCFEANKPEELPNMIEVALKNSKIKLSAMKEYKEKMLYKLDGKASYRARNEIMKRLKMLK